MDKTQQEAVEETRRNARPARRPYTAPKLVEYGSVAKLTQGNGTVRNGDGGSMMRL